MGVEMVVMITGFRAQGFFRVWCGVCTSQARNGDLGVGCTVWVQGERFRGGGLGLKRDFFISRIEEINGLPVRPETVILEAEPAE